MELFNSSKTCEIGIDESSTLDVDNHTRRHVGTQFSQNDIKDERLHESRDSTTQTISTDAVECSKDIDYAEDEPEGNIIIGNFEDTIDKSMETNGNDSKQTTFTQEITEHTRSVRSQTTEWLPPLPSVCAECDVMLMPGVAVYVFECYSHAVCGRCICSRMQTQTGSCMMQTMMCYVCEDLRLQEDKKNPQYESKNSMPLLSTEEHGVCVGQGRRKYVYPSQFKVKSVSSVGEDYTWIEPPFTVELDCDIYPIPANLKCVLPGSLFNTGHKDTIIACGAYTPTLTVLTPDGIRAKYKLTEGNRIKSGTFIHGDVYVICVGTANDDDYDDPFYIELYNYKLRVINLDVTSPASTLITPRHFPTLSTEVENPIHMFNISRQRYGVLCSRFCRGENKSMNIIHIYPLPSLILHSNTDTDNIQSHLLWGRRTVRLEGSNAGKHNTICVTPRGHFCLTIWDDANIRIYSQTGVYLFKVGKSGASDPVIPGKLNFPQIVTCTGGGDMIIADRWGNVHVFTPHALTWRCNAKDNRDVRRCFSAAAVPDTDDDSDDIYGQWALPNNVTSDLNEVIRGFTWYSVLSESLLWSSHEFDGIRMYSIQDAENKDLDNHVKDNTQGRGDI